MREGEIKTNHSIKNKQGEDVFDLYITPSKDMDKIDILLNPLNQNSRARSLRSTAELVNILKGYNIPQEEVRRALEFASERLRLLRDRNKLREGLNEEKRR